MLVFFKKNRVILLVNIIFILTALVLVLTTPFDSIRDYHVERSKDLPNEYSVYDNQVIVQTFKCNVVGVNEIEIPITTSYGKQFGTFTVSLTDVKGEMIQQWKTEKRLISTDYGIAYELDKSLKKGETYNLIIEASELDRPNALGVLTESNDTKIDEDISYIVCLYGEPVDNHIAIALYTSKPNIFAYISLILILLAINYCWFYKDIRIEKFSVPIMLILGLIMLLIIAPSAGPDEDYHYYTSVMMSNIMLGHDNVAEIEKEYTYDYETHLNSNNNFNRVYENLFRIDNINAADSSLDAGVRISKMQYPLSHIIPAIGITVARILHFNSIQAYTLARLFNLLVYIIIIQLALSIIPKYKEIMFVFAINPMAMQQATSLSYDALINSMSILFVSIIIAHLLNESQITWKDVGILTIIIIMFGPIKPVYIAHVLLVLILPLVVYKGKMDKTTKFVSMALVVLLAMFIVSKATPLLNGLNISSAETNSVVSAEIENQVVEKIIYNPEKYSALDVMRAPVKFAGILVRSLHEHFIIRFEEMFGYNPSYEVYTFEPMIFVYAIALLMCIYNDESDSVCLNNKIRIGISMAALIESGLVICAGFLMTNYGSNFIQGVQGRYFIPCLFLLLLSIKSDKVIIKASRFSICILVMTVYLYNIVALMSQIVY